MGCIMDRQMETSFTNLCGQADENKVDLVNHPPHYKNHPSGVECIQITEHMNFCVGNVIKYLWRTGLKDGVPRMQDLEKAQWYLNREIERVRGEK